MVLQISHIERMEKALRGLAKAKHVQTFWRCSLLLFDVMANAFEYESSCNFQAA
jgi:hypothetical protein